MAGAVNYYGKKYDLPEAYSDNASFLYWLPENKPMVNLILVCTDSDELQDDYVSFFKSAQFTDSVTSTYAREHGDYIMLAKGADERFMHFFIQKIEADKADMK